MIKTTLIGYTVVACFTGVALVPAFPAHADSYREKQWHLASLEVSDANAISRGQGVTVAVVDTGVNPHRDLIRNLVSGRSFVAQGGQGRKDSNGHGTRVASLIAAHGRGSAGVVGIAPDSKIIPVRYTDDDGSGGSLRAAEAIEWASRNRSRIINFSGSVAPSLALNSAIDTAAANDALVVASAGNRSRDVVAAYPAAMLGVLSVGASDREGKYSSISLPGKNVQLCAPGIDIESAGTKNGYWNGNGTSQAAAIASGAAALVRARFPDLSAPEVIHRLTATATDVGKPGRDDECGYGVLNVVKALTADVPPLNRSPGTSTPPSTPTDNPTARATPGTADRAGAGTPLIVGGIGGVVLLLAFLLLRRRGRLRRRKS